MRPRSARQSQPQYVIARYAICRLRKPDSFWKALFFVSVAYRPRLQCHASDRFTTCKGHVRTCASGPKQRVCPSRRCFTGEPKFPVVWCDYSHFHQKKWLIDFRCHCICCIFGAAAVMDVAVASWLSGAVFETLARLGSDFPLQCHFLLEQFHR